MTSQGRILLRTSAELHAHLQDRAKAKQQSLNDLCLERLSVPSSFEGKTHAKLRTVVAQAERLLTDQLLGVIFYGSQARGEGRSDSDWDFLIVAANVVPLARELYRRWDSLMSDTHANEIDVHFAHKPNSTAAATGFWSEIALDGIVLYEKDFELSMHLAAIRRDIASGVVVRRCTHGQSYWVHKGVT